MHISKISLVNYRNFADARGERVRRAGSDAVLVGHERDGRRIFFTRRCTPVAFD